MAVCVRDVLEWLRQPLVVVPAAGTVDGLEAGDPDTAVTGIAVVFTAAYEAIRQAAALGFNVMVTHEGVFYTHRPAEGIAALADDPVAEAKRRLIRETGIAIVRDHDAMHREMPDTLNEGLIRALGWEDDVEEHRATASILRLRTPITVREAAERIKDRLGIPYVRAAGRLDQRCERVGITVGFRGSGDHAIPLLVNDKLDLLLIGEGFEWETPEYVRDAAAQGRPAALIALGHAESEEPGMRLRADRLAAAFPGVPVRFFPAGPVYQVL